MGQVLKRDKIGAISEAAGDITLQASIVTIGGQQYTTGILSRTIATDVTLVANTRYQIYAVISAGVVVLRVSINENSVGPVGFNGWGLVGSMYASGAATFGAFVTITGIPTSGIFNAGPTVVTASTPPTKGTVTRDNVWCKQVGDEMEIRIEYEQSAAGAAGTGIYTYALPNSEKIDITKVTPGLDGASGVSEWNEKNSVGSFSFSEIASTDQSGYGPVVVYDEDTVAAAFVTVSDAGAAALGTHSSGSVANFGNASSMQHTFNFKVPIQGWNNTPIEDL